MAGTKNAAAVALGSKGGRNSRKNLSDEKKTELAQKAARARWGGKKSAAKKKPRTYEQSLEEAWNIGKKRPAKKAAKHANS
jgi:hypothetical protein